MVVSDRVHADGGEGMEVAGGEILSPLLHIPKGPGNLIEVFEAALEDIAVSHRVPPGVGLNQVRARTVIQIFANVKTNFLIGWFLR